MHNFLAGDHLLHGLIDDAAFAQVLLPLMREDPELIGELLQDLEHDGQALLHAIAAVDDAALVATAEQLADTALGLCAVRLGDIARRIQGLCAGGGIRAAGDYLRMVEPLFRASVAELRQRLVHAHQ